jgi:hypothetical protein
MKKATRRLLLLAAALALLGALAGVAMADSYDSPADVTATGNDTLNWTGQGGGNDFSEQCNGDTPAGTLLWIYTFDGATLSGSPILTINGTDTYFGTRHGHEYHFYTAFYDPDPLVTTAHVDFNVASGVPAHMVLTISHGCPGVPESKNLTIAKDAVGSYDRECDWVLTKNALPATQTVDAGQPAVVHYRVHLTATCNRIENVQVNGSILVSNPNADSVDISDNGASTLADLLSDGTSCDITPSPPLSVNAGGNSFTYVCDLSAYNNLLGNAPPSDLTNTASVSWPDQDLSDGHLDAGSASSTVDVDFTETLTDDCADLYDTNSVDPVNNPDGLIGHYCVSADGNGVYSADVKISYDVTYTGPLAGSCANHSNTASFKDNSTPQNSDSQTATVQVCSFGPRFTPGYWKNHLAKTGTAGCTGLPSGTSCANSGPFAMDDKTKMLGNYGPIDTQLKAAKVFAAMSCSFSGNAANQNQQAIGCLAGHLLAAKYNRNINNSNSCIDSVISLADTFLKSGNLVTFGTYTNVPSINYTGPSGIYTGISLTQRGLAIALKSALDAYNNGGYCH